MKTDSLYPMNIHFRYFDLEYFFQKCAENQFHNAELWLCPQHFLINAQYNEDPDKLLQLIKKYDVKIRCLTPEQNNPKPNNIAARSELLKNNTKLYFERVIRLASYINCSLVLVTPGWNYYDESPDVARERSIQMLTHLSDYASDYGITLAMETIWKNSSQIACNIEDAKKILEGVGKDNLKMTLDFGAMGDAGETVSQWMETFGETLVHCHFVDGTPTGHMPWGHGSRDMKMDLTDFYHYGYKGSFSMEYVHGMSFQDPERYLKETKKLFNDCLIGMTDIYKGKEGNS